jgi:hypothetical protein
MGLLRDPLDELIEGLEQAVPPSSSVDNDIFDLVLMQRWTTTILYGSHEDQERMESEPWYHEFMAQLERFNARRAQLDNRHTGTGASADRLHSRASENRAPRFSDRAGETG